MTMHKGKWRKDEPNGHKKEDCSFIRVNSKWFESFTTMYQDEKFPKICDINCEEKLTIVCMRKIFV